MTIICIERRLFIDAGTSKAVARFVMSTANSLGLNETWESGGILARSYIYAVVRR